MMTKRLNMRLQAEGSMWVVVNIKKQLFAGGRKESKGAWIRRRIKMV